jgi:hypothetical protein
LGTYSWSEFKTLTISIPNDIFNRFLEEFKKINIRRINSNYEACVCEISFGRITYNNFVHDKKIIDFRANKKTPGIDNTLSLIIGLAMELYISEPYSSLVENIAKDISYKSSIRVFNTYPIVIRILKIGNDENAIRYYSKELDSVLKTIDIETPIIYDFSNLDLFNTEKRYYINNYLNRKNSFILISNDTSLSYRNEHRYDFINDCCKSYPEKIQNYLLSLGIKKEKINYSYENIMNIINPEYNFDIELSVGPAKLQNTKNNYGKNHKKGETTQ